MHKLEFTNTSIDNLTTIETFFFLDNLNLLNNYYNNKNILLKYLEIAEKNKRWLENFISFLLSINLLELDDFLNKLNNFKKTNDINLLNLIEIIYNENLWLDH